MANNIFDQLSKQLSKAKEERPELERDEATSDNMLDESTDNRPRPAFFHVSHNSHGDWGKHWAHGGFEDDTEYDNSVNPDSNLSNR